MPDSNNPILDSVVSVANAKIASKILTPSNFEVLSVQPFKESTSTHNTLVTIKVDLGAAAPLIALPESDRYAKRNVKCTRIDLVDIAKFRNIEKNEQGQYILNASTASELANELDANLALDEIERIDIDEEAGIYVFRVNPNSLGWKGQITVAGEAVVPWTCSGNVTNSVVIHDSNDESVRQYNLRVKAGTAPWQSFALSGTTKLNALITTNNAVNSYLSSQQINVTTDSSDNVYFTALNNQHSFRIEIIPLNEAALGQLTDEGSDNTSVFITEEGTVRFCLAQIPPNVTAVTISNDTSLTTFSGDLTVQLNVVTTPNPAYTQGIVNWSVTAGNSFATVSNTGELMIIGAPDGSTITVRYETLNGVFTTKTFTTTDQPE